MLYTGMLMTENAFYPLFALVVLALVADARAADRRSPGRLSWCSPGLRSLTRAQAVALFGAAIAVAPVLLGLIERDLRRRLRAFATLYAIADRRSSPGPARDRRSRPLAARRCSAPTGPRPTASYSVTEIAHYSLWHVAELDLYVGVVPFAALLAIWLAPRALPPAGRAFVAATLPVSVFLSLEVAAFAVAASRSSGSRNATCSTSRRSR